MVPTEPESTSNRLGGKNERVEVLLQRGETFWQLSEIKYEGRHPIAAIFQANNLMPTVAYENSLRKLVDPVYQSGQTYVFPAWSEVEELEKKFYADVEKQHPELEGGDEKKEYIDSLTDEKRRSYVTINWDQTLYAVAQKKYGSGVPVEAIYEINQLKPLVKNSSGGKVVCEPIYPGGRTYWLPASNEIGELTDRYKERVKELTK